MSNPNPGRRRVRRLAAAVGALAAVSACARAPVYTAVNHQRVVQLSAPEVWRRVHAFLQDEGIAITSEDVASGVIDARQAEVGKGLISAYADCGGQANPLHPLQHQTLALTIIVKPAPEGALVTANAAFSQTLRARHAAALKIACASKGVLEDAVLNVASGQPMEAAVIPQ